MAISYEWDVETIGSHGDIIEHFFQDSYADCVEFASDAEEKTAIVLVRDVHESDGALVDRQWAYVESGKIPDEFSGGAKVPKRFRREVEKHRQKTS